MAQTVRQLACALRLATICQPGSCMQETIIKSNEKECNSETNAMAETVGKKRRQTVGAIFAWQLPESVQEKRLTSGIQKLEYPSQIIWF